jgi:hypothetical protein
VNPLLAKAFLFFQRRLFKIEAVLLAMYVVLTTASRWPPRNSQARLAGGLAIVLGLTVAAHWMQFKLLKIPLPFERTSVFLVPLLTALTGSILAIAPSNRVERVVRGAGIAGLMFAGVFFVGELRDTYFREWRNGADARAAFPVILELCRKMGVREVTSDWNLSSSFEFYRKLDGVAETGVEFPHFDFDKMPQGRRIYVLQESFYAEFIRREKLKAVWHGTSSDLQVLVRSDGSGL